MKKAPVIGYILLEIVVAIILVIGVYFSGWIPERGIIAVMLYVAWIIIPLVFLFLAGVGI